MHDKITLRLPGCSFGRPVKHSKAVSVRRVRVSVF